MNNEITKEHIEDLIQDFDKVGQNLCDSLAKFAMQQALKQMQVEDKNTKLLDEVIVYETEIRATSSTARMACNKIIDSIIGMRKAWAQIHGLTKEEYSKVIDDSEENIKSILKAKYNIKIDEKEGE